jgi:hypothetical protein
MKNQYQIVFQSRYPNGHWSDVKKFLTNSTFFLSSSTHDEINKIKREFAQDLPRFQTRTIKRRVAQE